MSEFPEVRPIDEVAQNILQKRYFHPGETTWAQVARRVVDHVFGLTGDALKEGDKPFNADIAEDVYEMILNRYFIPNSPCLAGAGKPDTGLSACFVVDFEDSTEDIMKTFSNFVHVARKGGGCGTTLSKIRPQGAPVAGSAHGYAAGPIALYDALCHLMKTFTQGGLRPMAQMGTMSVRHPDIKKFITAKAQEGLMTTTNLSVVVDNDFMHAVQDDRTYWTEFDGVKYEELRARDVYQMIVDGAWRNGEPGLLFYEKMNYGPYEWTGQVINATNPCAEQPLPPNGVCNLGSLDVSKFVRNSRLDWQKLAKAVQYAVDFLDAVIDAGTFPTNAIRDWALANRPIGIGIMGFADYLLECQVAYGSVESLTILEDLMGFIDNHAHLRSMELARLKGVPEQCQKLPSRRRNMTLLSIAPTGTISLLAGCSSGIEPIFSEITVRTDNTGTYNLHHPKFDQPWFRCAVSANGAKEVTWEEHLKVQNSAQKYVDSGVSKTINCPKNTRRETVWEIFLTAWNMPYIKGLTIYRNQSRSQEVLTPKNIKKDKCPSCGEELIRESGCKKCSKCNFSVCEII